MGDPGHDCLRRDEMKVLFDRVREHDMKLAELNTRFRDVDRIEEALSAASKEFTRAVEMFRDSVHDQTLRYAALEGKVSDLEAFSTKAGKKLEKLSEPATARAWFVGWGKDILLFLGVAAALAKTFFDGVSK